MEMCNESKTEEMEPVFPFKPRFFLSLLKGPLLMKTAPALIERQRLEHPAPRRDAIRNCAIALKHSPEEGLTLKMGVLGRARGPSGHQLAG